MSSFWSRACRSDGSEWDTPGAIPDGCVASVVSRYEENEYQTVGVATLQEILDAIGVRAVVTFSA